MHAEVRRHLLVSCKYRMGRVKLYGCWHYNLNQFQAKFSGPSPIFADSVKKRARSVVGLAMQVSGNVVEVDILELSESPRPGVGIYHTSSRDWGGRWERN